jgi:hypothetical protein
LRFLVVLVTLSALEKKTDFIVLGGEYGVAVAVILQIQTRGMK